MGPKKVFGMRIHENLLGYKLDSFGYFSAVILKADYKLSING